MIDEYMIGGSNTGERLVTMSHSSQRRGDIWKKAPRTTAASSTTPPIRPSNSFVEKVLRDCLKPRNYRLTSDDGSKHTGTPTSQSDKSTNTEYQQTFEYIPAKDYSYITPPRKSRDSRHDPPGSLREFSESARTVPPPRTSKQSWDFGRVGDGARTNPVHSPYLGPRDRVFVADTFRSAPMRRPYLPPRDIRSSSSASTIAMTRSHIKDYEIVGEGVGSVPPLRRASNSKDFGIIGIASPHTYNRQQLKRNDLTLPKTPRHTGRVSPDQQQRKPTVSQPSSSSSPFSSFQEEREQALRDYKVTIEYKHLKSHAPGGVYLIPSMDSLRNFHGIIFVRRGPFTNGIFKFRLDLPPKYNDTNMWPKITFSSTVYNPYVDEKTGELDIKTAYPTWDPSRHYLVTVLTFLKKIFYSKNFADAKANPAARELFEKDPAAYKKKVESCVHESQKKVYVNEKGSTAKFTEEEVAHRVLRDLLKHHIRNENQVTKQTILAQVEKSRKV